MLCPTCGTDNQDGILYCEECGELLHSPTSLHPNAERFWLDSLQDELAYGVTEADGVTWLMLQPHLFYQQRLRLINGRLLLGRLKPSREYSSVNLQVEDLNSTSGMSRVHAAIMPMEHGIGIQDMDSTNGTWLNGQRLAPGRLYHLHHQDQIELGHFGLQVHFVEMSTFVQAIRENLVRQFHPSVREILSGMVIPTEALTILLHRLPDRTGEQYHVVTFFKEKREAVTLERLHEMINKVLGNTSDETHKLDDLVGSERETLEMALIDELANGERTLPARMSPPTSDAPPLSPVYMPDGWFGEYQAMLQRFGDALGYYAQNAEQFADDERREQVLQQSQNLLYQLQRFKR